MTSNGDNGLLKISELADRSETELDREGAKAVIAVLRILIGHVLAHEADEIEVHLAGRHAGPAPQQSAAALNSRDRFPASTVRPLLLYEPPTAAAPLTQIYQAAR